KCCGWLDVISFVLFGAAYGPGAIVRLRFNEELTGLGDLGTGCRQFVAAECEECETGAERVAVLIAEPTPPSIPPLTLKEFGAEPIGLIDAAECAFQHETGRPPFGRLPGHFLS